MQVFLVLPDIDRRSNYEYQSLKPKDNETAEKFADIHADFRLLTDEEMTFRTVNTALPKANFPTFVFSVPLIADTRGLDSVLRCCSKNIELYKVHTDLGDSYHLVNLLPLEDCVDEKKTTYPKFPDGRPMAVELYQFRKEKFSRYSLFRTSFYPAHLLVVVGGPGADPDFKSVVEEEGLTGLRFVEVWNDGGREILPHTMY